MTKNTASEQIFCINGIYIIALMIWISNDIHSNLFWPGINDDKKGFITLATGHRRNSQSRPKIWTLKLLSPVLV
jgi:hypothetical protein